MRNSSEIILLLKRCLEGSCQGCAHESMSAYGECEILLMDEARQALADMQARCARYAEEIMMLQERLKEANHE